MSERHVQVSVCQDAVYHLVPTTDGAVCSGKASGTPLGLRCPLANDVAVSRCSSSFSSFNGTHCVAFENAECRAIHGSTWGCVFPSVGCRDARELVAAMAPVDVPPEEGFFREPPHGWTPHDDDHDHDPHPHRHDHHEAPVVVIKIAKCDDDCDDSSSDDCDDSSDDSSSSDNDCCHNKKHKKHHNNKKKPCRPQSVPAFAAPVPTLFPMFNWSGSNHSTDPSTWTITQSPDPAAATSTAPEPLAAPTTLPDSEKPQTTPEPTSAVPSSPSQPASATTSPPSSLPSTPSSTPPSAPPSSKVTATAGGRQARAG